ncbi:MAG TPA: hypothetical protein VKZ41_09600 [Gemmatimonadales bacterium]|nr:hypothetical protein [Gemmatimonadales bacterium]
MARVVFILLAGIVIGYLYGWRDAQAHDEPAYTRVISGIGGETRNRVRTDVDAKMNELQR